MSLFCVLSVLLLVVSSFFYFLSSWLGNRHLLWHGTRHTLFFLLFTFCLTPRSDLFLTFLSIFLRLRLSWFRHGWIWCSFRICSALFCYCLSFTFRFLSFLIFSVSLLFSFFFAFFFSFFFILFCVSISFLLFLFFFVCRCFMLGKRTYH